MAPEPQIAHHVPTDVHRSFSCPAENSKRLFTTPNAAEAAGNKHPCSRGNSICSSISGTAASGPAQELRSLTGHRS